MAAGQIIVPGAMPTRDRNGRATVGKLFFYEDGTQTPAPVYTSQSLTTALPNPVVSDAAGRFPSIWADDAETFTVVWTYFDEEIIKTYSGIEPGSSNEFSGPVQIGFTAEENDVDALRLTVDAAGFGDVKALNVAYDTGAIQSGEAESPVLVNINNLDSTGGTVTGVGVLTTDGSATVYAVKAGAQVGPILQDSGTFANPTTGTNDTPSTNVPAMIDGSTGTSTTIFVADNDYIIIGAAAPFTQIAFVLNGTASDPGVQPTFGYSTAGAGTFTAFSPIDGTNGFRNSGIVAWEAADLTSHGINSETGTYDIKITRTRNSAVTVSLYYAKVAATSVYKWDKNGNLTINTIEVGNASDTTLARSSAGNLSIEGNVIYRADGVDVPVTDGGTGASNASAARTNLGLGIGTDVQAYNARLQDISANLTATSGTVEKTGANTFGTYTVTAAGKALMDDADAAAQRTTLAAVGTAELAASGGSALVGFLQAGSGAVSRTVQAKLRDFVSVTDFGATGNGTTNDAAAIALAVTACSSGKTLYFPPGEYLVTATTVDAAVVLPAGVNLYMEPGAWLIAGTSFGSFIAPLGNNIIVCNIDGRGYPSSGGVTGTWTIENVGIRAYFSAPIGLGADNVTIVNSQIKNVSYGVFGVGSEKWRVQNNYIHRVKQSCVQFGFYLNQNSLHNLVYGNTFEDAGDYAVVYYQQSGQSDGIGAYNSTIGNTAKNMNQRTNGYAYGVEQGTVAKQVGFVFADNVYETDVTTGSVTLGGITITTTTDSVVSGNLLKGSLGSSGDVGINCLQAINATITGNNISSFRGGAVDVDGSSGALVQANSIKNCGGASASSSPLIVAQLYSTSNINVIGNTFEVSSGYAYYGAAVSCIYVESIVSTTVSGVSILNNTFVNPNDRALTVQGVSASLVTKLTFAGNVIRGIGDATFFAREPVYMDYAKNVVVSANAVSDAKRGYVISNCEYVVWQNNNNSGSETISTPFYTVTATTNMRINWNTNSQTLGGAGLTPIAQFVVANSNFSRGDVVLTTENYGVTGVIATGATVNHGLTVTPTNVIITPADTGVTDFYVSALGATTFVINYSGGGTHAFYWQATY